MTREFNKTQIEIIVMTARSTPTAELAIFKVSQLLSAFTIMNDISVPQVGQVEQCEYQSAGFKGPQLTLAEKRAKELLDLFVVGETRHIRDLCEASKWSKATIYGQLRRLIYSGHLEWIGNGRYRLRQS